jgi:multiple sugar transport system substrate-binding protein
MGALPAGAQDKIVVTWFVGLGTGTQPEQQAIQDQVAADFNASQNEIELKINYAGNNQTAPDVLSTMIAAGTPPDIVGPVGVTGSNAFAGQWLDLQPLVDASGYDLSQYAAALVDSYREGDALLGIPFAVFPGLIYYNVDLFDEAGLNYPPTEFDAPYVMPDGTEVPWDYDTVAEIAKFLTVDANGIDATMEGFDPSNIVQFGFDHQWDTIRSDFSTFGGSPVVNEDGQVVIPENWREHARWMWNALWVDHFMPNNTYINSDLFQPHAFGSGNIAMTRVMLWYTCCLGDLDAAWDLAVVPSYNGTYYAPVDLDTFRVHKDTQNPEATFTVLQYLLGEGALDLLTAYGGYAARPDLQDAGIQAKADIYPSVTNWSVVAPSLAYAPLPHHETWYPNFNKGQQRFSDFGAVLRGDAGADMDLEAELDKLQSDLQAIVDESD